MKARTLATTVMLAPLAMLGGCVSSGGGTGLARVSDLMAWIERVHVETELSKQKLQAASDMMASLTGGNFKGDVKSAFEQFVLSIQNSEEQALKLRSTVRQMNDSSVAVFDQWSADLLKISNPQMRARSEQRLENTRERYQTILSAARTVESGYDSFNQGVRDLSLFLNNDLNPQAVAEVNEEARLLADLAVQMEGRFNRCLDAAREYLATATPGAEPGAEPLPEPPARGR